MLPGGRQQGVVLQGQQAAVGGDAVGEGGQVGHIGELRREQGAVDIGIGVAVERSGTQLFIKIGDHQVLAGIQVFRAA